MVKKINYSPYEKQVLLACVKEYANIIEDKGTDRRTTNEKENAGEALANKYADANVTMRTHKQLGACWKKLKKAQKPRCLRQERHGFKRVVNQHLQPFQMIQSPKPFVTFS